MDDVLERLRVPGVPPCICNELVRRECKSCVDRIDARAEIERLRAEIAGLRDVIVNWQAEAEMQEADRLRLQARIDEYAEAMHGGTMAQIVKRDRTVAALLAAATPQEDES